MIPALSTLQWVIASACSVMVGLTKTGLPALATLIVPLFAIVLPARASTGALLPLLIFGDAIAVLYYRRTAVWKHLVKLLPWAVGGIVIGFLLMGRIDDRIMRPVLGAVVLIMLAVSLWRDIAARGNAAVPIRRRRHISSRRRRRISSAWWFAALMGLLAGTTTMVANAAGPVMMIYLLAMRLPKDEFIGTSAWFFFFVNWIKLPFSIGLGLITVPSLALDAVLAAGVLVGAAAGILAARRIPERAFGIAMLVLTALAAVRMFF
jgi:uncharacterized protein